MAQVKKTALVCSLYLVWSIYCSLLIQGIHAKRAVKPMLFINMFDDKTVPVTTVSSKLEENEIKSAHNGELQLVNEDENSVHAKAFSTETNKLSSSTQLNRSENVRDLFTQGAFFGEPSKDRTAVDKFESPSSDNIEAGVPNDAMDSPEPCGNVPLQITRIYFKTISTLIQHIIDSIFSPNETPMFSTLGDAQTFDDDNYESNPTRKLRKRDVPQDTDLNNSTITSEPDLQNDTHTDLAIKNTHLQVVPEGQVNAPGNETAEAGLFSEKTVTNVSIPSSGTELPNLAVNTKVKLNAKTDSKHETTLNNKHQITEQKSSFSTSAVHSINASTSSEQSFTQETTTRHENKDDKLNLQNETVSNEKFNDLNQNDSIDLLDDQASTGKKDSHNFQQDDPAQESKLRLVEQSNEEISGQETSFTAKVTYVTGTLLAVIVAVAAVAAAVYTYVWKRNVHTHQAPQHSCPGPSSQRSAIA